MRPLAELDAVDWERLGHAYGTAADVPGLLRALTTDTHERALDALYGNIFHQGSRYEAAAHAVPFLLGLVADPATPARADLVLFLGALAIGYDESHLPSGVDVEAWRSRVATMAATDPADAFREFDEWVAAAVTDGERRWRELQRRVFDPAESVRAAEAELAAYEAVLAGAPVLVDLLVDPAPEVRVAALYVLGWLPTYDSVHDVLALLDRDEPDGVVATAVVALGLLGVSPAAVRPWLTHPSAAVRWAAAVALTRLGDVTVAGTLASFVADPPAQPAPPVPFHDGDLRGYAAVSLAEVRDRVPGSVLDALLAGLGKASGLELVAVTSAVLWFVFGPSQRPPAPFAELTAAQQRVVLALVEVPAAEWRLGNFTEVLRAWRLPGSVEELRTYAGL